MEIIAAPAVGRLLSRIGRFFRRACRSKKMGGGGGGEGGGGSRGVEGAPPSCFLLFFQEVFLNLLNLVVVVFLYPPFALLILLPLRLHRRLAQRLAAAAAARDPRLGAIILSGTDALHAAPAVFTHPKSVIPVVLTFGESLTLSHISSVFNERVLSKRDPTSGEYAFPQMRQRIVSRYGYRFWADVEDPALQDQNHHHLHFRYLDPADPHRKIVGDSELMAVGLKLGGEPLHPERRSPWEVVLIPNFESERDPGAKCVVILRIHHCLADGYSIASLMRALAFTPWDEDFRGKGKTAGGSPASTLLTPLMAILRAPYYLLKFALLDADRNEWVSRAAAAAAAVATGTDWQGSVRAGWTEPFSLAEVKAVAAKHGVCVSSVLIMLQVGAVERGMRRKGFASPSKVHVAVPLPLPGHPGVGNHHTGALLPVRIHPGQPLKTLKGINSAYADLLRSPIPLANHYVMRLMGGLPVAWMPPPPAVSPATASLTNLPVAIQPGDMFGCELREVRFGALIVPPCPSCSMCLMYGGKLSFSTGGHSAIFPQEEDIQHFTASFRDTLNSLHQVTKTA